MQHHKYTFTKTICLAILVAIAIGLRFQGLNSLSFWFDEACSWRISQFPWQETLDAIARDAHPPLYYFACKLWIWFFGKSVLAARSLSLVFGIATIFAAIWFCHEADEEQQFAESEAPTSVFSIGAIVSSLLIGTNAFQIELSQEARPYTLGAFLSVVAASFVLRALRKQTIADWTGLTLSITLLSFTHYYCLFTVGAIYLCLATEIVFAFGNSRASGWRLLKYAICSLWFVQLAWLPWWSTFFRQLSRANAQLWMQAFSWDQFAAVSSKAIGLSSASEQSQVAAYAALTFWVILAGTCLFSGMRYRRLLGMCALCPLLMTIAYSITARSIVGDRYLLFSQTFLMIILAQQFRPNRRYFVGSILVAGFCIWGLSWTTHDVAHRRHLARFPGTKGAIEHINLHRTEDTALIIRSPFVQTISIHYLDETEDVYTISNTDYRSNILSGPSLRPHDLLPTDFFSFNPKTVWTVDTIGLFEQSFITEVPLRYEVVLEKRFAERYHFRMDHIVRKYELSSVP